MMTVTHLSYLAISVGVTIFVARTLKKHGPVFMSAEGGTPTPLINAKSHLLNVGFYLINFGMIALTLKYGGRAVNAEAAVEILSTKLGGIILAVGLMHFLMMGLLASERNNSRHIVTAHSVPSNELG